jgi:hypothetical protein
MRSLTAHGWGKRVLAMISVYLDESGIHAGAKACVVAGYTGTVDAIVAFSLQWKNTLKKAGLSLADFHARDLIKIKSNLPLLRALASRIALSDLRPISASMGVDDYLRFNARERKFLAGALLGVRSGKLGGEQLSDKPYFIGGLNGSTQHSAQTHIH